MIELFQLKSTGKMWVWRISVSGNTVTTRWGEVGGAKQETSEHGTVMNVGKANEISAEQQAALIAERRVTAKKDAGWVESFEEAASANPTEDLDYDDPHKKFTPSKPNNDTPNGKIRELEDRGDLIVQRKFDGMCHIVFVGSDGPRIFTRGKLEDRTEHFRHIANEFAGVPAGSIIVCEVVDGEMKDQFRYVSSVVRTKDADKAIAKQEESGYLRAMVFDVLHWGGEDLTQRQYRDRVGILDRWFRDRKQTWVCLPINLAATHTLEQLFENDGVDNPPMATEQGWEGYVIWDASSTTEIRFDGKPKRIGAYKWKPIFTEDVWVDEPYEGKGRNEGQLGGVCMYQYNTRGERVAVGKCGGGFSQEERATFWEQRSTMFPCAMEVESPERNSSMALRFPQFLRLRPDKSEAECTMAMEPRVS